MAPAKTTAKLHVERLGSTSRVTRRFSTYPMKLVDSRVSDRAEARCALKVYVIGFGGGLVQDDKLGLQVHVGPGASLVLTTQASTKVYKSPLGKTCAQDLTASLDSGAVLVCLPSAVCPYTDSRFSQSQVIDLDDATCTLVLLDWMVSGRYESGERWAFASYASRTAVRVGGELAAQDGIVLAPHGGREANRPGLGLAASMGAMNVVGSLLLLGPRAQAACARLQSLCSAHLVENGLSQEALANGTWGVVGSYSPLQRCGAEGAMVRFATTTAELARAWLREGLDSLRREVGEDLFTAWG